MASIGNSLPTYVDVAKRLAPNGNIDKVVEILAQTNEILTDAVAVECNDGTNHKTTIRSGLPKAYWRAINQGVPSAKSTTVQISDGTGMLEVYSEIDKDLAELNGNSAQWRLSEERAFIEGLNQQMAQTVFYGDTSKDPRQFMGLAPRFNDLSAANAQNVVDAGGTGTDNTSIWLVVWGENTCHMIYPKGSVGGLRQHDLGEETLADQDGGKYQGYRTHYQWKAGLVVRDWRYVVRVANIDVSNLTSEQGAADLVKLMVKAYHKLPSLGMGRAAWYCNRTVRAMLDIQAASKANVQLSIDQVGGKPQTSLWGVPIRTCDQILNTEARVV